MAHAEGIPMYKMTTIILRLGLAAYRERAKLRLLERQQEFDKFTESVIREQSEELE